MNRQLIALFILTALFGVACGIVIGRLFYTSELTTCLRTSVACELTAQGTQHMMEGCLDQQEKLDVCEMGMTTAKKVITHYEDAATHRNMMKILELKKKEMEQQ